MRITDEIIDRFVCDWLRDAVDRSGKVISLHPDDVAYNERLLDAVAVILDYFGETLDNGENGGSITLD